MYSSILSLTSVQDGSGSSTPCSGRFTPREDPVLIANEAGLGPRAGVDGWGKSRLTGISPRTTQPVASRYTDTLSRFTMNNKWRTRNQ